MKRLVLVWLFASLNEIIAKGQTPLETAPDFLNSIQLVTVTNADKGNALIPLQKLITEHKQIILNFVSARCSHSRKQLDNIRSVLRREGKNLGRSGNPVPIVFVFVDRSLAKIRRTLKETFLPSLVVWDKDGKLSELLKVKVTPTIIVFDQNAKPVRTYEGFLPDPKAYQDFFAKLVKAVVKGSPLPPRPVHFYVGISEGSCTPAG